MTELAGKKCEETLKPGFIHKFDALLGKANSCNNVAVLKSIKAEAVALLERSMNEISEEEAKLVIVYKPGDDNGEKPLLINDKVVVKKKKVYSIKSINSGSAWQLETEEDVDKCVQELKDKLLAKLEENTIIRIEF